jgi:hypothetical protein
MKRTLPIAVMLAALGAATSGCSDFSTGDDPRQTVYEVTGDPGTKAAVTRTAKDRYGNPINTNEGTIAVPWNKTYTVDQGETTMEATPTTGAVTCRIVVSGMEIAKVVGKPAEKVTCKAIVS